MWTQQTFLQRAAVCAGASAYRTPLMLWTCCSSLHFHQAPCWGVRGGRGQSQSWTKMSSLSPYARCQWVEKQTAVPFFSTRSNLITLSQPYLWLQQQFSLTQISNALNMAPFALYPSFFIFIFCQELACTSREKSLPPSTNLASNSSCMLHSCAVFWAQHCWRISPGGIQTLCCTAHQTPLQILRLTEHPEHSGAGCCVTTTVFLQLWAWKWEDARKPLSLVKKGSLTQTQGLANYLYCSQICPSWRYPKGTAELRALQEWFLWFYSF